MALVFLLFIKLTPLRYIAFVVRKVIGQAWYTAVILMLGVREVKGNSEGSGDQGQFLLHSEYSWNGLRDSSIRSCLHSMRT